MYGNCFHKHSVLSCQLFHFPITIETVAPFFSSLCVTVRDCFLLFMCCFSSSSISPGISCLCLPTAVHCPTECEITTRYNGLSNPKLRYVSNHYTDKGNTQCVTRYRTRTCNWDICCCFSCFAGLLAWVPKDVDDNAVCSWNGNMLIIKVWGCWTLEWLKYWWKDKKP